MMQNGTSKIIIFFCNEWNFSYSNILFWNDIDLVPAGVKKYSLRFFFFPFENNKYFSNKFFNLVLLIAE